MTMNEKGDTGMMLWGEPSAMMPIPLSSRSIETVKPRLMGQVMEAHSPPHFFSDMLL